MTSLETGHQAGRHSIVIEREGFHKPPGAGVISQKTILSVAAEAILMFVGDALAGRELLPNRTGSFKVVLRCLANILGSVASDTQCWASRRKIALCKGGVLSFSEASQAEFLNAFSEFFLQRDGSQLHALVKESCT